jgi:ectopic P granules protein 5
MTILSLLFSADKTYVKLAKEAMTADARGPVLTFLGNMIQYQIVNYQRYGFSSPSDLIQLWANCLIRLKDWSVDPGVVWILDLICQVAYPFRDAWMFLRETLRPLVTKIVDTKVPKSSGLMTLIASEDKDILFNPTAIAPTLSLVLLELEFENIEVNTGFWGEFLCQLMIQNKTPLAAVLKKTLTAKQLPLFPVQSLSVFKFAKLIMKMHPKHWIFPIVCQQFFSLFMHRVPGNVSQDEFGVQDRFYDADVGMMKKLKKIFTDSETLHMEFSTNHSNGSKSQFHTHCAKIFKTFLLWLEETRINQMTQQNIILPPQYDHQKLKEIFRGNRDHWTEFVYLPELNQAQKADCNSWLAISMRFVSNSVAASSVRSHDNEKNVTEKMFVRLGMNGKPMPAPEVEKVSVHIGAVDSSKSTLQLLRNESKTLQDFAQ